MADTIDLRGTFLTVVAALGNAQIDHAFIGALPVLAWGRVRATTDIDLVIATGAGFDALRAALESGGFRLERQVGPTDASDTLPDIAFFRAPGTRGTRVDVFLAKTDFERTVIATARTTEVLDVPVRLARPEASIIYKLIAARPKDLDDIEGIFAVRQAAGDALDWTYLDRWATEWGVEERLAPYRFRFRST